MPVAKMNSVLRVKKQKTDRKDAQLLLTLMKLEKLALAPWASRRHSVASRMLGLSAIDRG